MTIKVVCLNMWQGGNLFEAILEFIQKEKPDILTLQEVYNSPDPKLDDKYRSVEVLASRLDLPYHVFAPAFLDNRKEGKIEEGNAIFSRFPIMATNVVFFDQPYRDDYTEVPENFPIAPRNLQHAVIKAGDIGLNIFNTQGIWGLDGTDNERKLKMSEVIVNQVKDKPKVILAGDFNLQPNTQTIANIEQYLSNVFKDELISSFNMRRKDNPGYATAVVDMMFISPDIKVTEHYCPNVDISDHLPLVASLEV